MVEAAICRLPVVMRWRIFYSTQGGNSILGTHGDSDEARDIEPARAISEACLAAIAGVAATMVAAAADGEGAPWCGCCVFVLLVWLWAR
eukprot:scaffold32091_cov22-Cyclotella_meneghiniana.AAC.3